MTTPRWLIHPSASPGDLTPTRLHDCVQDLKAHQPGFAALDLRARATLIERVARGWLEAPDEAVIHQTARDSGYAPEMVRWGLEEALSRWRVEPLLQIARGELGAGAALAAPPVVCGQVLASTVPPAGLQSIMFVWLLGGGVLVRPSQSLSALLRAWLGRLPEVLQRVTVAVSFEGSDDAMCQAFADLSTPLVVHGSDATIHRWRALLRPSARMIARGHRVSAAFLSAATCADPSALRDALDGVALDLCAWDQTGCLSPLALFVEVTPETPPLDVIAEQLATRSLPPVESRLPPGEWSRETIAARTHYLRACLFDADVFESESAALIVHDSPALPQHSCLHRVLSICPVRGVEHFARVIEDARTPLQGVAVAGDEATRRWLARRLTAAGLNRVCAPGDLQRPPLDWRQDGEGVLAPLVHWVGVEP